MDDKTAALEDDGYFNLGTYHRPITTKSPDAQRWFNRGLIWAYGLNHQEASNCFDKVIQADPDCAMGYWGLANTRGRYYDKAWRAFDAEEAKAGIRDSYNASRLASNLAANASPVEQALINAIVARYPHSAPTKEYSDWDRAYADSIEAVYKEFSGDLDVVVFYAEALMNLVSGEMWDPNSGEPVPEARTLDVNAAVTKALAQKGASEHPGLLQLYIRLMERSRTPEVAIPSAQLLRSLVPDSGHFSRMASRIDILLGGYRGAIAANAAAIKADARYMEKAKGRDTSMNVFYRVQKYHSLIYAAMMSGQSQLALDYCIRLEESLPVELLETESPPLALWLEFCWALRIHVLVRFGRWDEIIQLNLPDQRRLFCTPVATIQWAKCMAYAAMGDTDEGMERHMAFVKALMRVPSARLTSPHKNRVLLQAGITHLNGHREYFKGNYEEAFNWMRQYIEKEDGLMYSQPWGSMQPARHVYGAMLLEQGRVEEAAKVYAEDLGIDGSLPRYRQHPNNIWALRGYHECLMLLGRTAEAKKLEFWLKMAESVADVPTQSSAFLGFSAKENFC
ncbi:TPR-like protein [Trichoderma longibrachiatum ATCC 18648]|uniref:TPR-like protein n=1 Tax=Trichoderma longibrachiatum ATCC 18648 TaxID=983965 RepID=A0A2T4BZZ0_TRILO|nr:TPR-like protein [Trichoderma longibrachiatum ATCC 18648]